MPEHDTFDLDAAFRDFEHDVAGLSRPRGAVAAIATARRRRRTTWAGIAAGLALVTGTAAVAQGVATHHDADGPAGAPAPAVFDAAAFNRATTGWVTGWRSVHSADMAQMGTFAQRCVQDLGTDDGASNPSTPEAARAGDVVLTNAQTFSIAVGTFFQWSPAHASTADDAYAAIRTGIENCPAVAAHETFGWAGARGQSWEVGTPQHRQHLWLAEADHGVAVLWTTGGGSDGIPDQVDRRVMTALVAGLGAPGTYRRVLPSVTTHQTTSPLPTISAASFADAVHGWHSGWRREGSDAGNRIPCAADWNGAADSSSTAGLGGNGDQAYATFADPRHAQGALERIRTSLAACAGSSYFVPAPVQGGDVTVLVATGPRIVWAVAFKDLVGVVSVPAGGVTTPPRSVTTAVTGQLLATMTEGAPRGGR